MAKAAGSLEESVLEAWATHQRIHLAMLGAIDDAGLAAVMGPRGRSVFGQFAHTHNVRLMWLETAVPEALTGLEKLGLKEPPDRARLAAQLEGSGRAVAELLRRALATGQRVKGFKGSVVVFLGYLIAHEAHHRGQAGWTLKHAGHPLSQEAAYALWDWGG